MTDSQAQGQEQSQAPARRPLVSVGERLSGSSLLLALQRRWRRRRRLLADAAMLVALLVTLATAPAAFLEYRTTLVAAAAWYLLSGVLLVALAWRSRTVSLRTLLAYWFVGAYPVYGVVALTAWALDAVALGELGSVFVLPFAIVGAIFLPLALYYVVNGRRGRWHPSALDGALLGYALGFGAAYQQVASTGAWTSVGGSTWAVGRPLWSYLLPFVTWQDRLAGPVGSVTGTFALGFVGVGTLLGASLGVAFLFRHYYVPLLLPLGAAGLAAVDLATTGWFLFVDDGVARGIFGRGTFAVYVLVLGVALATGSDWYVRRRVETTLAAFPPASSELLRPRVDAESTLRGRLDVALVVTRYARYRNAATFALWRATRRTTSLDARIPGMVQYLYDCGVRAGAFEADSGGDSDENAVEDGARMVGTTRIDAGVDGDEPSETVRPT